MEEGKNKKEVWTGQQNWLLLYEEKIGKKIVMPIERDLKKKKKKAEGGGSRCLNPLKPRLEVNPERISIYMKQ